MIRMGHRPSISAVCKNLSHWTVVLIPRDGFRVECIFTDENDLTRHIRLFWNAIEGISMGFPGLQATGEMAL